MAEKGKKLDKFKISETQKPTVANHGKKDEAAAPQQESFSLGYEKIEKLLEKEDSKEMIEGLHSQMQKLTDIEANTSAAKEKSAAQKAALAYQHTLDLLGFLFKTKETMLEQHAKK